MQVLAVNRVLTAKATNESQGGSEGEKEERKEENVKKTILRFGSALELCVSSCDPK